MKSKLTVSIRKDIVERAKAYAKGTGRSLSELIESYLTRITADHSEGALSPKLSKIVGAVRLPEDLDVEGELRRALEEKHLK
jgi:hypothetical protein